MNIKEFLLKQIYDIKKKGFKELLKKLKIFFFFASISPFYILSIPIYLFIILMRPFLIIRVGEFNPTLFGVLAPTLEVYCCEEEEKKKFYSKPHIDLFYFKLNSFVSNKQINKMCKRTLIFLPTLMLDPISKISNFLGKFVPYIKVSEVEYLKDGCSDRDIDNLFSKYPPHLKFNDYEERKGEEILRRFGLPKNAQFACLSVRDSAYDKKYKSHLNWEHNNFRNCDVDNFILAANEITKRGYWVFRMGKEVEKKLNTSNPKIIDYANSKLCSDFMDVYLGAKCNFCVSTGSGFEVIPYIFRKPIAHIAQPLGAIFSFSDKFVSIIKHHVSKKDKKKLSISEIFLHGAAFCGSSQEFKDKEIELEENSAEEIRDLAMEVLERTEGTWKETSEDKNIQLEFKKIFNNNLLKPETKKSIAKKKSQRWHRNYNTFFCAQFLRNNKFLLK